MGSICSSRYTSKMQVTTFLVLLLLGISLASEEYLYADEEDVEDDDVATTKKSIGQKKYADLKPPKPTVGLLYPRESETREVRSLDGMWRLLKSKDGDSFQGVREKWFENSLKDTDFKLIDMPVPASYNDITTNNELRDHVGTVWYERNFFVSSSWEQNHRTWLRFGSVNYAATVWLNGKQVMYHDIGHLPFEADITSHVKFGHENRLTVMCDNRLNETTMPPGKVVTLQTDDGKVTTQRYSFDFFNYAGIQRSVQLYTTPLAHIRDIDIKTTLNEEATEGQIEFCVLIVDREDNPIRNPLVEVKLRERDGSEVSLEKSPNSNCSEDSFGLTVLVVDVKPWWPYLMHPEPGYLYKMEIELYDERQRLVDIYRLPVGIRNLSWNSTSLMINGKRIYLRGFGKHEDSDIRGKGLDNPLMTRDFNLLKWIGANVYRTSHYPYSEESMQFADEQGIMIIDECSAVNLDRFEQEILRNHMSALEQLIHRDRNYASVIAWSIANEARSHLLGAFTYFKELVRYTRSIAHDRPLTGATLADPDGPKKCKLAKFLDIIGFNRYHAWYRHPGRANIVVEKLSTEAKRWHNLYKKPVVIFEYGADTMEGLHLLPAYIWSEEYQLKLFSQHFKAFDQLRQQLWFIGEFVWNFADFKTAQTFRRVGGNKKGVFTRNRQPKMVAHLLRQRYFALGKELDNCSLPKDLYLYISNALGKHDSSEL